MLALLFHHVSSAAQKVQLDAVSMDDEAMSHVPCPQTGLAYKSPSEMSEAGLPTRIQAAIRKKIRRAQSFELIVRVKQWCQLSVYASPRYGSGLLFGPTRA